MNNLPVTNLGTCLLFQVYLLDSWNQIYIYLSSPSQGYGETTKYMRDK